MIDDQLSFTDHIATLARPADLPYTTLGRLDSSCQSMPHKSLSKLLFSPDWTIVMLSWRAFPYVLSSLCNWSRMQQPEWSLMSQKISPYLSLHQVTLATHSRSYQIQGTDVCLQDNNWRCTNIPKLASANVGALQKLASCKWMTPCGAIPKRYKITLTDLFLDCAQLLEWPLDLNSLKMLFFLLVLWSILICWIGGFLLNVSQNHHN